MRDMTPHERLNFLMSIPARTGKLASVRPDGRPHVTPIWYTVDGDDLIFTTWHEAVKAANLIHDNRVSLCVDDERPPFAYVIIEGKVDIQREPEPDRMLHWTMEIASRYMGADKAEQFGKRNAVEGEWLLRIKPTKIIARTGIAD
ncbi:MAG: PPOX class F420-dependent oxidoreductase [Chloroflexi bacterium]|nr:PPOX class F420-dependent oxidoreductase [Chloroflexota bacterium]